MKRIEKKNICSIDLLPFILQDSKQRNGNKKVKTLSDPKLVTLTDDTIIEEDEKKLRDYFLKQKEKKNASTCDRNLELSLNKEQIEHTQEIIIEQEEPVPEYPTKNEKYVFLGNSKRRNVMTQKTVQKLQNFLPNVCYQTAKLCGWFNSWPLCLKGGADHNNLGFLSKLVQVGKCYENLENLKY